MALKKVRANLLNETTGEKVEGVDVMTSADAVLFDDTTPLPEELDSRLTYSNTDPMPVAVGGYPAGTTFPNKKVMDVLTGLLYPYTKPLISLSANPAGGVREKGTSLTPIALTATTTKKSEAITRVEFFKSGASINAITSPKQGGTETYSYPTAVTADCSFSAKVTDAKGGIVESAKIYYTFVYPAYVGALAASIDTPTSANITALTKKVVTKANQTNAFTITNQRMCFACPPGWTLKQIVDPNGFDITASFAVKTVSVACADGSNQNYTVYISAPTTQTGFTVKFNI